MPGAGGSICRFLNPVEADGNDNKSGMKGVAHLDEGSLLRFREWLPTKGRTRVHGSIPPLPV